MKRDIIVSILVFVVLFIYCVFSSQQENFESVCGKDKKSNSQVFGNSFNTTAVNSTKSCRDSYGNEVCKDSKNIYSNPEYSDHNTFALIGETIFDGIHTIERFDSPTNVHKATLPQSLIKTFKALEVKAASDLRKPYTTIQSLQEAAAAAAAEAAAAKTEAETAANKLKKAQEDAEKEAADAKEAETKAKEAETKAKEAETKAKVAEVKAVSDLVNVKKKMKNIVCLNNFRLKIITEPEPDRSGGGEIIDKWLYFENNPYLGVGFHYTPDVDKANHFDFIKTEEGYYILKITKDPHGDMLDVSPAWIYFQGEDIGFHYTSVEKEATSFEFEHAGNNDGYLLKIKKDPGGKMALSNRNNGKNLNIGSNVYLYFESQTLGFHYTILEERANSFQIELTCKDPKSDKYG
jgi:archaellum component FlaD/FlaE